jgi:O-antigen ligase
LYGVLRFVSGTDSIVLRGTFVNRNHLAGYLELIIPVALGLLLAHFDTRRSGQTLDERLMKHLMLLFMAFLMVCALVLTGSRAGILSFGAGVICFIALTMKRRLLQKWMFMSLLSLVLALGVWLVVNPDILRRRVDRFAKSEGSFQVRSEVWKSALHIFQDFPVFGAGLGTFPHLSRRYKTFEGTLHFEYAENDYVQFLAETGILGSAVVTCAGVIVFSRIFRSWRKQSSHQASALAIGGMSALVSIALHSSFDFNLHIPANMLLFCVVAAVTYIASHIRTDSPSRTEIPHVSERISEGKPVAGHRITAWKKGRRYVMTGIVGITVVLYIVAIVREYTHIVHSVEHSEPLCEDDSGLPHVVVVGWTIRLLVS